MIDINSIVIRGRLVKDPILSYTKNQKALCKFAIANNRGGTGEDQNVGFFHVVCWGKIAEATSKYCVKGSAVTIQGTLEQSRWEDQNGQRQSWININARLVQFDSRKKSEN